MGNTESQGHKSHRQTPPSCEWKRRSLSPSQLANRSDSLQTRNPRELLNAQNSSASFHSTADSQHQAAKRRIQQRRAKSFRAPNKRAYGGSFRVSICQITGLNENQKLLLKEKWLELDRTGILDMSRNVFETVFKREKRFLRVIGLTHLADRNQCTWKSHMNFRTIIQKFSECINEVIRNLDDPERTVGTLHEFGAYHYCNHKNENADDTRVHKLPSAYWDSLVFAINNAAKDLQVESSRGSESPSRPVFDKRFLLPGDDLSLSAFSPSSSPTPIISLGPSTPRRYGSVCPTLAEAWNQFATYAVGQMKFGFDMERLLQSELRRLIVGSMQFSWQSPFSDDTTNYSSRDDGILDGLSIQTNTTAVHGGGSISSSSNSSNSSSGSSANAYTSDLPSIDLIRHGDNLTLTALAE